MKKTAISQVDALFVNGFYPIEFLFFFHRGLETRPLREALKKMTFSFWPVFGRFEENAIVYEGYNENDFFDEETVDLDFVIPESEEERFNAYSPYRLSGLKNLFFIKTRQFKNGTTLICHMNHLAGDGYSYFYFLSVLAGLARKKNGKIQVPLTRWITKPHHRRTSVKNFTFKSVKSVPFQQPEGFRLEHLEYPRSELHSLLRNLSSQNLRLSTNDVLSATVLKKITDLKGPSFGQDVCLTIPIDIRRNVKTYGPRFFGNGIMLHRKAYEKEELITSSIEQTAVQIRESMPPVSQETYRSYLATLEDLLSRGNPDEIRPFDPKYGCLVTNLSRLPTEKLNFGSGSPALVFPLTVEKNSAVIMSKKDHFMLRLAY